MKSALGSSNDKDDDSEEEEEVEKRDGPVRKKTVVMEPDEDEQVRTDNPFFGQVLADYQDQVGRCIHVYYILYIIYVSIFLHLCGLILCFLFIVEMFI